MSRKKGTSYVVDDDWRKRVEERLLERGWKRADLVRESKVGKSTVSDLLNGRTNECVNLPKIHHALGWNPPLPPVLSADASELFAIYDMLDDFERGRVLERARAIYEQKRVDIERRRRS